jgi:hypothetical protein
MTPTLCHCGRHKDRCRCAGRREGMRLAAADLEGLAKLADDDPDPEAARVAATILLKCATRIRALAKGAP